MQLQSISDNPAFTQYRNINSMIFEDCIHALPGTFVESWRKQQFDPKYLLALYRGDFKTVGNAELVEPYVGAAKKIR